MPRNKISRKIKQCCDPFPRLSPRKIVRKRGEMQNLEDRRRKSGYTARLAEKPTGRGFRHATPQRPSGPVLKPHGAEEGGWGSTGARNASGHAKPGRQKIAKPSRGVGEKIFKAIKCAQRLPLCHHRTYTPPVCLWEVRSDVWSLYSVARFAFIRVIRTQVSRAWCRISNVPTMNIYAGHKI